MSRRAVIIIFSIIIVLIIAAASGGIYYLNRQANRVEGELQEQAANLKKEKKKLEKDLRASKEENKELQAEIEDLKEQLGGATGSSSKEEEEVSEADLIEQAIINKLKSDGLNPADFKIEGIKYKNGWATGGATPYNPSMEGALFILQKKSGKWVVIAYGTGLEHSDYPASPSEIWP